MATKVQNGLDLVNQRIINVGDPSGAQDAATKNYVDAGIRGIEWKNAVQAASTGNVTVSSAPSTIDGITLVSGNRVLLKNQTAGAENGIYTFSAAASPLVRATDLNASTQAVNGVAVSVTGGTANADTSWVLTTTAAITLGTTSITFSQLSGGAGTTYSAGNGLSLTSTTFAVVAGSGIIADGTSTRIDTSVVPKKFAGNVGDGSSTSITVTHSLGTRDVIVQLYAAATPWDQEICDVTAATTTTITLAFAVAPASNFYRVVVMG